MPGPFYFGPRARLLRATGPRTVTYLDVTVLGDTFQVLPFFFVRAFRVRVLNCQILTSVIDKCLFLVLPYARGVGFPFPPLGLCLPA